ncbi:hypothetical protein [Brevinema andersonii]|nr:hypothetical protein [Brevinema andersonii]
MDHFSQIRRNLLGTKYQYILSFEKKQNEYFLDEKASTEDRLVYRGNVLDENAKIIYLFRFQRLIGFMYIWEINKQNNFFIEQLQILLKSKYQNNGSKTIKTSQGEIFYYFYSTAEQKEKHEMIHINLEHILFSDANNKKIIILEFQPYDADSLLKNKILNEDI